MPYAPRLQEIFEGVVCDNILAIVKRDMKPALDYFYPAGSLPDFTERTLGTFIRTTLPSFTISPRKVTENEADDFVANEMKFDGFVSVGHAEAPEVTRLLGKYCRAFKSIIRNASIADYTTNVPANLVFALTRDLSHEYDEIAKNPNNATEWMRVASFELTLKFNER